MNSIEYLNWLSMEKRITGLVRKLDTSNIRGVADEIMNNDLVAGRGLFCRAVMRSQSLSPASSNLYAAFVAIINSQFPDAGLLLVKRAALGFRAAFDGKNLRKMLDTSTFLAYLVNRAVVYEVLAFDVILLLLGEPSSVNVHVAVRFCTVCGRSLLHREPHRLREVFMEFRRLMRSGKLEKRVQVSILRLMVLRRTRFGMFRCAVDHLNRIGIENRVTHQVSLLHDIRPETSLDEFKPGNLEHDECEMFGKMTIDHEDFGEDEFKPSSVYDECEMFGRMTIRGGDSVEDDEVSSRAP